MPNILPDLNASGVQGTASATATIANGASLSDAVKVAGLRVLGIVTPAAMSGGGNITFQGSVDGTNFFDLFTSGNVEVSGGPIATSRYCVLTPNEVVGLAYIKVRTGTSAAPIPQGAQRLISVVVGS